MSILAAPTHAGRATATTQDGSAAANHNGSTNGSDSGYPAVTATTHVSVYSPMPSSSPAPSSSTSAATTTTPSPIALVTPVPLQTAPATVAPAITSTATAIPSTTTTATSSLGVGPAVRSKTTPATTRGRTRTSRTANKTEQRTTPTTTPTTTATTTATTAKSARAAAAAKNGAGGAGAGDMAKEGEAESKEGRDGDEEVVDNSDNACSTCGLGGDLICCEACPRVFHAYCANPPVDLENTTDDKWFCRVCRPPSDTPLGRREGAATSGAYLAIVNGLHRAPPIHFYIPDTILQSFPAELRAKVAMNSSTRRTRRNNVPPPSDFVCFRCVQQCRPDNSAKCCECNTMFHYNCVSPPLTHVGATQPWRCPLHPPERHNRRFQQAKMGLRDFEPWMYTHDVPLHFLSKVENERALQQKATIQEQQAFLDCLSSMHTSTAVPATIITHPPQDDDESSSPSSSSAVSLMPIGRALTGDVGAMSDGERAACIESLRRVVFRQASMGRGAGFHIQPHQEAYLIDAESCVADARALAQLVSLPSSEETTGPSLRLTSTGERVALPEKNEIKVGFDDTCDINLAKYVIIDTPIAQNTHALLTFDPALRQHTLFAPPSATSTTAPPSSTPSTTPPVAERIMVRCGPRKSFEPIPTTGHALASGDIIAVAGVCFVYTTPAAPA
ncbi:hypothetical protein PTSG_11436 [Salpingoeca rosetta]|uniref:PHD-type domain-containing protein n=1 Tax=Salpingoeca rosetta (strain ATCC 50818 / BSB-021) TaxID=946362 RepID=F2UTF3_SALR5|nr:uncharacterized protein PTSG_11436 [Salpingoeca rosetta]EGD82835.1 hypothetical protein PTSG_11436 [Salpingoeca rosetta]|eukprot:XP_004987551.1 hypothetical protein PTSG_11436 [Salpingoeca rosetta]